jgi:type I restriction enzyme S subunit
MVTKHPKPGYKLTEIGEIPEGWEVVRLGEVSEEVYRYPTYYNIEYVEEGVPEIRGELIKENGKIETDLAKYRYISYETSKRFPRTILKEGDFVITVRGTMGKIAIVPKELEGGNITANLIRISLDRNRCFPHFNLSPQTTIKTIKAPVLKSINLPLPSLTEQQKITEILSEVDEKIDLESKQKEKMEELKKGLMQSLLTGKVRVKV